jgi:DNA-binding Xre family transcriptional regulator
MIQLRLKELAEECNTNLHQVHQKTGIRYATLVELSNNKRQSISFKDLEKIITGFDLPITEVHRLFEKDTKKVDKRTLEMV